MNVIADILILILENFFSKEGHSCLYVSSFFSFSVAVSGYTTVSRVLDENVAASPVRVGNCPSFFLKGSNCPIFHFCLVSFLYVPFLKGNGFYDTVSATKGLSPFPTRLNQEHLLVRLFRQAITFLKGTRSGAKKTY